MTTRFGPQEVALEMGCARLGDARRSRRLARLVAAAVRRPDASFPMMAADESELEGIYRFLNNPSVDPAGILEPHLLATTQRVKESEGDVLVVHDTTYFKFQGDRSGMGRVHVKDQGFWAHVALAITSHREALGVIGLRYGTRLGPSRWKGGRQLHSEGPSENRRWLELPEETAERVGRSRVVHVMDREADWFELMKELQDREERFVIRLTHDRLLEEGGRVSDLWEETTQVTVERNVELSARAEGGNARQRRRHPGRNARKATLELKGVAARLRSGSRPGILEVHVVKVQETDAPEGAEPVVWNLVTTEPVETAEDLQRVVDIYRARWTIEEYFKAVKTGCSFEKRQLGSYAALLNALAVFLPIAWALLRFRDAGRSENPPPVEELISRPLLAVLRLLSMERRPLVANPNAKQLTYAIAGLGGHLPRNGHPGWQTLGRGMERLLEAATVLRAAGLEM